MTIGSAVWSTVCLIVESTSFTSKQVSDVGFSIWVQPVKSFRDQTPRTIDRMRAKAVRQLVVFHLCGNCAKTPSVWGVGSCDLSESSFPKLLISGTSV